jgi:hypothetical protein
MACDIGYEEWTFHMRNDRTGETITILFCFKFDNGLVSGFVFDSSGTPFPGDNRVTGMRVPTPQRPNDLMSIDFRWDKPMVPIRIFLIGNIFLDTDDLLKFNGRFIALPALAGFLDISKQTLASPDVGDTGTGNGTQT